MPEPVKPSKDIGTLLEIMTALRDPVTGCPWDQQQTFETIAPYTVEEAYEVAGAIQDKDWSGLKDELGDLLLQVVYHARMAQEGHRFDFGDVVEAITTKMIARHPHVFERENDSTKKTSQRQSWEELKTIERRAKGRSGVLDGVTRALPALVHADKLQKRLSSVGFDWHSATRVVDKIAEEAREVVEAQESGASQKALQGEIGDLLFAVANLARHLSIDPEAALRATNAKVIRRWRWIETELARQGRTPEACPLNVLEELWQRAKAFDLSTDR